MSVITRGYFCQVWSDDLGNQNLQFVFQTSTGETSLWRFQTLPSRPFLSDVAERNPLKLKFFLFPMNSIDPLGKFSWIPWTLQKRLLYHHDSDQSHPKMTLSRDDLLRFLQRPCMAICTANPGRDSSVESLGALVQFASDNFLDRQTYMHLLISHVSTCIVFMDVYIYIYQGQSWIVCKKSWLVDIESH